MTENLAAQLTHSRTPELDVRVLREHAAGDALLLAQYVSRRAAGEPVAHIVGSKGFWTLDMHVTRDVLTPRPDTETILDALLKYRPRKDTPLRILDLGTGSGCLILSALSEYPHATGDAVDVSEKALGVARGNAERLGFFSEKNGVEFFLGSWCDALPAGRMYDVILSNPPYIPTSEIATLDIDVRGFEPLGALDGGEDGLDCYRTLAMQMQTRMVDGAIALIEVGAGQSDDVADIMKQSGLAVINTENDLAGIARVVVLEKQSSV